MAQFWQNVTIFDLRLGTDVLDFIYEMFKLKIHVSRKKLQKSLFRALHASVCARVYTDFLKQWSSSRQLCYCKLPKLSHIWHSFGDLEFCSFSFRSDGTESKNLATFGHKHTKAISPWVAEHLDGRLKRGLLTQNWSITEPSPGQPKDLDQHYLHTK